MDDLYYAALILVIALPAIEYALPVPVTMRFLALVIQILQLMDAVLYFYPPVLPVFNPHKTFASTGCGWRAT